MSHELTQTDTMVYAGDKPWHGLGSEIPEGTTVAEGFKLAKLDWLVQLHPVYAEVGSDMIKANDNSAVIRMDTKQILGVVGSQFTPVQNVDAFAAIDKVVGSGIAHLHTAGSLKGGKLVWALLKLPGEIRIKGNDVVGKFVTMISGHDGRTQHMTFVTPTRIVCWNTMQMALGSASNMERTKHTRFVVNRINNIAEKLGQSLKVMDDFGAKAKFLAATEVKSSKEVEEFLLRLNFEENIQQVTSDRMEKHLEGDQAQQIHRLFEHGKGNDMPEIRRTYWALFNGVTEFVDHFKTPGGKTKTGIAKRDARLTSAWTGTGAALKTRALDLAVAMASKKED